MLPSETPRVLHQGNGTRGPFSLSVDGTPISFSSSSHIKVWRIDNAGVKTLQVEGTHYDLSASSALPDLNDVLRPVSTATLSFKLAQPVLAADEYVLIEREAPPSQDLALATGGGFSAKTAERTFDAIVRLIQQLFTKSARGVYVATTDDGPLELPPAAERAGKFVAFDEDGLFDVSITQADVQAVADLSSEIAAVAGMASEINVVNSLSPDISALAAIAIDVTSLAGVASDVALCADNITPIQSAAGNASAAASSASDASDSAAAAATSETNAAISESNASASAASAETHKDAAEAAKTAAEAAQVAAEAAQVGAENAAASINQALSGVVFEFDSGTSDADPGAGNIRFNHATFGSVTQLFVSETDDLGAAVGAILDSWDDSTSSNRAYVIIRKRDNPVNYVAFYITASQTDAGVYRKFTVSYSGHSGAFSDGDVLGVIVERTGDIGPSGPGSGDVVAANAGSEYGGVAATFRGNVSAAPRSPEYLVGATNSELSAERVVTDTATISWDLATGGQAKANLVAGGVGATQLAADAVQAAKIGDNQVTLGKMAQVATDRLLGRDTTGTGNVEALTVGGGLEFSGSGGIQRSALTGDVTAAAASNATTIANDAVTYAKMQNAPSAGFIGATGAGDYGHRTPAQMRADLDLEAGTDFEAYASALATGVVEIFIPAGAMTSRTTNGAGSSTAESSTNKVMQVTKDFDQTTQEFVQFTWIPPKSWNLSTVSFIPVCIPAGSSGGWVFGMAGVAISNDDVIDAAFGTAQTSADTFIAATDVHVGPESSAITVAGAPAAGDIVVFQINRTVSDGGDTHNGDVKLLGIKLRYTINAKNDA